MSLTRTAARTRTRTFIAEPAAKSITDDEINSWIDDACRDISIKTLCNQAILTAITTTSGTTAYSIPTTLNSSSIETIAVKTIINSSGLSLQPMTLDMPGRVGAEGATMQWSEWADKVILTPTPTAAYTLYLYVWTIIGCTASGTIAIDPSYHHIIPLYCTYAAMLKKREFEASALIYKTYLNEMSMAKASIASRYAIDNKLTESDQSPQD